MEDVMETCWIDSVTMCSRGYKCETCPKSIEFEINAEKASKLEKKGENLANISLKK